MGEDSGIRTLLSGLVFQFSFLWDFQSPTLPAPLREIIECLSFVAPFSCWKKFHPTKYINKRKWNMAQKPATIVLIIIGAALCFVGVFLSMAKMPLMGFWGLTGDLGMGMTMSMNLDAFGSLTMSAMGTDIVYPGGALNMIPGIMILAGAGLAFVGIRVKALGIVGGIIALVGPVIFIVLALTNSLTWTNELMPGVELHMVADITSVPPVMGFLAPGSSALFGAGLSMFGDAVWSLGVSAFLPMAGGILATIGAGVGKWE
jgi:hypothetical protein